MSIRLTITLRMYLFEILCEEKGLKQENNVLPATLKLHIHYYLYALLNVCGN